jgi:hypothetical protein
MLIVIWTLGLLLLLLWSATMWAAHVGWQMLATLPWSQAAGRVRELQLPPWLELWLGPAWRDWLEAAAPMIEWLMRVLQGSAGWLEGLMPIVLLAVWGAGAFVLLLLTTLAAVALGWWRGRRRADTARAA